MKKLMIVAAAAFGLAAFGDIESSNTVGYTNAERTIPTEGYYIGNMAFAGIGGDGMISVANILTTTGTPGTYDTMSSAAPQIQVLDANGESYTRYYYLSDAYNDKEEEVLGWADQNGDLAETSYPTGTGFWYWSRGAGATITLCGEVDNSASGTKDAATGYSLIGNPYSTAIKLTDIVCEGIVPGTYDTMATEAPQIQFLNADGESYTRYYYMSDAYDADSNEVTGWANENGDLVYDAVAPVTAGFWLWNRGSTDGRVTIKSPLAK